MIISRHTLAATLVIIVSMMQSLHAAQQVDVRDFGAKGDGITDDSEAFQKAIDSLETTGGLVSVPSGEYRITKTLLVGGSHMSPTKPKDIIEIRGASAASSRLLGDGVDYIIAAKAVYNSEKMRQPVFGLLLTQLTLTSFTRGTGLEVGGLNASFMLRWSSRGCVFLALKTGIYSLSRKEMTNETPDSLAVYIIRIQNNIFYACGDYAIKLGRIFDLVIENNEIEHGVGGIAVGWPGDGFDAAANTIRIENNIIEGLGPGEPAIKGSCWIGVRIVGNYFEANQGGDIELVPIDGDGWVRSMTISGNTFQPTPAQLAGEYGPIKLTKAIDTVIYGNFTTGKNLLHPESGSLGKGVNIASNTLNNPIAIGDIKGASAGNASDYIGKLSRGSVLDAERFSVTSPVASVGIHSLFGFQYTPTGEQTRSISYGSDPPTGRDVEHAPGDVVLSLSPKEAGSSKLAIGWICIEAGKPGEWREILVEARK